MMQHLDRFEGRTHVDILGKKLYNKRRAVFLEDVYARHRRILSRNR